MYPAGMRTLSFGLLPKLFLCGGLLLSAAHVAETAPKAEKAAQPSTAATEKAHTAGAPPTVSGPTVQPGDPKDAQGNPGFGPGAPRGSTGAYGDNDPNAASVTLDRNDQEFVQKLAGEAQTEIAIATLGIERASDERLKNFARELEQAHSAARSAIMDLAKAADVAVGNDLKATREFRSLKREKSGFDREFMDVVLERHRRSLKRVEVASRSAKHDRIREFASQHAEVLRRHIAAAEKLRTELRK